jgi:hypothetical protein
MNNEQMGYAKAFASLGGKSRAKSLTKARRSEIAKNAAKTRWEAARKNSACKQA